MSTVQIRTYQYYYDKLIYDGHTGNPQNLDLCFGQRWTGPIDWTHVHSVIAKRSNLECCVLDFQCPGVWSPKLESKVRGFQNVTRMVRY